MARQLATQVGVTVQLGGPIKDASPARRANSSGGVVRVTLVYGEGEFAVRGRDAQEQRRQVARQVRDAQGVGLLTCITQE